MATHEVTTTAEQNGPGEPTFTTVVPQRTTGKLHVDISGDNTTPNSTQETMSGDEKTAVESTRGDTPKIAPVVHAQTTAPSNDDDADGAAKEREEWEQNRRRLPRKAGVKWSDYEHFKSRYSPEEGLEIIEVLYGRPDFGGEISQEKTRKNSTRPIASRRAPSSDNRWIQRVRIESPVIIPLLAHLTGSDGVSNDWPADRARVFFRPFQTFYHTLPLMKKCVEILESPGQTEPDLGVTSDAAGRAPIIDSFSGTNVDEALFALDPATALQQLRVYVEFVENNIIPMWVEAAGTSKQRSRWCDLPMFFHPGELLYTAHGKSTSTTTSKSATQSRSTEKRAVQNVFKLISVVATEMEDMEPSDWRHAKRNLEVLAYHVDFDGEKYGPVKATSNIREYSGEQEIRSLYVYPLRYEKDREKMEAELCKRGKRFLPLVRERHCHYDGWTLLFQKYGHDLGDLSPNAEYIDGEVMIDFKEGSRAKFGMVDAVFGSYDTDPFTCFWGKGKDITQTEEDFDRLCELALLKRDYFARSHKESKPWLQDYATDLSSHFDDEKYILLPQLLVAYSFRARKFFTADIDCVSSMTSTKHSFRDLRINPDHKRTVKSLTRSHFDGQDLRRHAATSENLDQDFIRGKGAGLIILLHGVPGVGKTTTAEAVALHNRKPLFTITSADLGFKPSEVENALQEFFRLAQIWDCVLLLDEADLFLSRREVQDLERNALVSVFLRVLEYYSGILFLTTNRVGTMDEAFKSRIHVSLYYPPLDIKQTLDIFKVNLKRLHEIEAVKTASRPEHTALEIDDASILNFARNHFDTHGQSQRWNGRQIRNAFQVAYSLAQFSLWGEDPDESDQEDFPGAAQAEVEQAATAGRVRLKVDSTHFKIVNQSIERFDRYLLKTRGADADTAKTHQIRNDRYKDPREDDRRSFGPDYRSDQRLHPHREIYRSPTGRGAMFDAAARSRGQDQDEEEDDRDSDGFRGSDGGPDYGKYRNTPARQHFSSSHSSPVVPNTKRGQDRYYGQRGMGGGDEFSPDDTGYGRGGSMSSGRANSYGRGGYEY